MCLVHQVHLVHLQQDSSSFGQEALLACQVRLAHHLVASFQDPCPFQASLVHGVLPSLNQVPCLGDLDPLGLLVQAPFVLLDRAPLVHLGPLVLQGL